MLATYAASIALVASVHASSSPGNVVSASSRAPATHLVAHEPAILPRRTHAAAPTPMLRPRAAGTPGGFTTERTRTTDPDDPPARRPAHTYDARGPPVTPKHHCA